MACVICDKECARVEFEFEREIFWNIGLPHNLSSLAGLFCSLRCLNKFLLTFNLQAVPENFSMPIGERIFFSSFRITNKRYRRTLSRNAIQHAHKFLLLEHNKELVPTIVVYIRELRFLNPVSQRDYILNVRNFEKSLNKIASYYRATTRDSLERGEIEKAIGKFSVPVTLGRRKRAPDGIYGLPKEEFDDDIYDEGTETEDSDSDIVAKNSLPTLMGEEDDETESEEDDVAYEQDISRWDNKYDEQDEGEEDIVAAKSSSLHEDYLTNLIEEMKESAMDAYDQEEDSDGEDIYSSNNSPQDLEGWLDNNKN